MGVSNFFDFCFLENEASHKVDGDAPICEIANSSDSLKCESLPLSKSKNHKNLISTLKHEKKIQLIGLPIKNEEDILDIAYLCRSRKLCKASWICTLNDKIIYQNIVSIAVPSDDVYFLINDIFDMRSPGDISWFVRESTRWNRANGIYISIFNPVDFKHDALCREIELNNLISFGGLDSLNYESVQNLFCGIIITNKERFTNIRANGEIFGDVPIRINIYDLASKDDLTIERTIATLSSTITDSELYALMITTDVDSRITGIANVPINPLLSMNTNSKIELIERLKCSNDSSKCFMIMRDNSSSEFKDSMQRLKKRGIFDRIFFLSPNGENEMQTNFYEYLNRLNANNSLVGDSALTTEEDEVDKNDKDITKFETQYRKSQAPHPPIPKWFNNIRNEMKDKLVQDVKDQYDAELKEKKAKELQRLQQEQMEAQQQLAQNVESNNGNINGLGNGQFLDPNANNPKRVQLEGSMATVE